MTKKRKRGKKKTFAVLPLIGIAGAVLEPAKRMATGDFEGGLKELAQRSTGINLDDGTWHPEWLGTFWIPIIVGSIGHKVANLLGLNRTLANLPAPLNKLRL